MLEKPTINYTESSTSKATSVLGKLLLVVKEARDKPGATWITVILRSSMPACHVVVKRKGA